MYLLVIHYRELWLYLSGSSYILCKEVSCTVLCIVLTKAKLCEAYVRVSGRVWSFVIMVGGSQLDSGQAGLVALMCLGTQWSKL